MARRIAVIVGTILFVLLAVSVGLSLYSRKVPQLGLDGARLRPCPGSPNCVCSEDPRGSARVAPLRFEGDAQAAWARARQAVLAGGGSLIEEHPGYLRASFETRLLRFVDDLELRLDVEAGEIHVRSASRVGRSDFGANRARVERLRQAFATESA